MSDVAIAADVPVRPRNLLFGICVAFMLCVLLLALLGPVLAPKDPNAQNLLFARRGPSANFWLGTDLLGRDVLSRTMAGARTAVVGPLIVALTAMLIGTGFGLLVGYRGGLIDAVIMRFVDLMFALPSLLVAIVVVGVLGGGYPLAVAMLALFYAPQDIRVIRAATLEQRALPYVEAARSLGVPALRIVVRHILPNTLPMVVATVFLHFAFALVSLSALSYLGLGISPDTPDWGRMLADGRPHLFVNPLAALVPGIMIVLTAASMNLIGDFAYEQLADRGRAR
jgi:peptide/nickel transport system permease protein